MPGYDPEVYVSQPTPSIQQQQYQRVNAVLSELNSNNAVAEVQKEIDLMTEARTRFAKAALYEQMITGQLFEGDDPVTLEVENEFKEFAEERLMVLLGMHAEKLNKNVQTFDAEQVEALKMLADKILKRQVPVLAQAVQQPKPPPPQPVAQLAAPKRGRGRPPGTKKEVVAPVSVPPRIRENRTEHPASPQVFPIEQTKQSDPPANPSLPDKRVVTLPNGQVKEVTVSKGQVKGSGVLPMPSPEEMVALAQMHGEMAYKNHGALMQAKAEIAPAVIPQVVQVVN